MMVIIEHHVQNSDVQMSLWPRALLVQNNVWPVCEFVTNTDLFSSVLKPAYSKLLSFSRRAEYSIIFLAGCGRWSQPCLFGTERQNRVITKPIYNTNSRFQVVLLGGDRGSY